MWQRLIEAAQEAVWDGADCHDPRVRALGQAITAQMPDFGSYRRARRGLGLSKRQARERVAEITGYAEATRIR